MPQRYKNLAYNRKPTPKRLKKSMAIRCAAVGERFPKGGRQPFSDGKASPHKKKSCYAIAVAAFPRMLHAVG
jgi:hypothetical protein